MLSPTGFEEFREPLGFHCSIVPRLQGSEGRWHPSLSHVGPGGGGGGIVHRIGLWICGRGGWTLFVGGDGNVAARCAVITAESEVACPPRASGGASRSEPGQAACRRDGVSCVTVPGSGPCIQLWSVCPAALDLAFAYFFVFLCAPQP